MAHRNLSTKVEEFDKASTIFEDGDKTEMSGYGPAITITDDDPKKDFDVKQAWEDLMKIPGCGIIYLDEKTQKEIGLEIGMNVSQEFPWKQVKYKDLFDHMPDEAEGWSAFQSRIDGIELEEPILIGLANHLQPEEEEDSVKGDMFIAFTTHHAAFEAGKIIRNIEMYERWVIQKQLIKRCKSWVSLGSEKEVDITIPKKRGRTVDVEVQSVYPVRTYPTKCVIRNSDDVRDGYVELVPGEKKFDNVFRKRADIGIQSAPETTTLEQQTDPTFPTNAWSQYLYEVTGEDEGLDPSDDEGKKPAASAAVTPTPGQTPVEPTPPPPPEMSDKVKKLLEILEFNQIDMYRNDYPLIADKEVSKYVAPHMVELVGFANIKKSFNRYVSGIDWYPKMSGLVAVSYSFTTLCTMRPEEDSKVDAVNRAIVEPNPVLLWSFEESLEYKLEFIAPREIIRLSFCPYDADILVGGATNGQIVLWDLHGRVSRLDQAEVLTTSQIRYRALMQEFLSWTKPMNEDISIQADAVSVIETSQSGPIVQINWLSRKHYVSKTGKVYETAEGKNRFFVTTSFDGSIAFWNLDTTVDAKALSAAAKRKLPPQLMMDVSPLKRLDRAIKPEFMIRIPEAMSGCILDDADFIYEQQAPIHSEMKHILKVPIVVKPGVERPLRMSFYASCILGKVHALQWEGFDIDTGDAVNTETLTLHNTFPVVHDGFILGIERNPYNKDIFISYGKFVFAIWREGFHHVPMLWRKIKWCITSVKWSHNRPAVFFLSRNDGLVEAWDLLARSDAPSLTEPLGGGLITAISEHRPSVPKKVLGIGDYNSNFRMMELPNSYKNPLPQETEKFQDFLDREVHRKTQIKEWQKEWFEKNGELIQAKKEAEAQILLDLERLKKEEAEAAERRARAEEKEQKKAATKVKSKAVYDLPQRLEEKFDQMILQRYMEVLMERKRVDPEKLEKQTFLEKERLRYEKTKKIATKKNLKKLDEEISAARAMLLPVEKSDLRRSLAVLASSEHAIAAAVSYVDVEPLCNKFIEIFPEFEDLKYHECLDRGRRRQEAINVSLGANTGRRYFYKNLRTKEKGQLLLNLRLEQFLGSEIDLIPLDIISDELDMIPVKDEADEEQEPESEEGAQEGNVE